MLTLKRIEKVKKLPKLLIHFSDSKINFNSKEEKNKNNFCNNQSKVTKLCTIETIPQDSVDEGDNLHYSNKFDKVINFYERRHELHCKSKEKGVSVSIIGGGFTVITMTILLKQNPAIKEIRLIDTDNSLIDRICDIRNIDTSTIIRHFKKSSILDGLRHSDIVALMDESNFTMADKGPFLQFIHSSNYVKKMSECIFNACPNALVAVFTRPVTATLPLVSEIYKSSGDWDPNRIFGSAALESMRISAMAASLADLNPSCVTVPLSGGVDSLTVVPLLSRARPFNHFTEENECLLIDQLRSADMKLFNTEDKDPTLSSGMAAAKFISTMINGLRNESISITNAYVRSNVLSCCQFMTSEIQFGPNGVQTNFGLPKVSSTEISMIEQSAQIINKIVKTATRFLHTGKIQ